MRIFPTSTRSNRSSLAITAAIGCATALALASGCSAKVLGDELTNADLDAGQASPTADASAKKQLPFSSDDAATSNDDATVDAGPSSPCGANGVMCGSACVDVAVDSQNCGACANACLGGQVCSNGQCATTCGAPTTLCEPVHHPKLCANLASDNTNCGTCGTACATGTTCSAGACVTVCPSSQISCGGACVDPATDRSFCGATAGCGEADAGSPGAACGAGMVCNAGSCDADCSANLLKCGASCVDTQHDPLHCGSCDAQCALANGLNVCNAGSCSLLGCTTGFSQCPPVWMGMPITSCSALATDPQNCGWCGNACNLANATSVCSSSACAVDSCNAGFLDCDKDPSDGCETQGATCPTPKKVFVTSATFSANMGGYAGADAHCATAATTAGLSGTFLAWVSDGATTPQSRFAKSSIPYALVDGTIVANNFAGLTSGYLRHAISLTESGGSPVLATVIGYCNVWTGTDSDGNTQGEDCSSWSSTSGSSTGTAGTSTESSQAWSTQCGGAICGAVAALYCFEQ